MSRQVSLANLERSYELNERKFTILKLLYSCVYFWFNVVILDRDEVV